MKKTSTRLATIGGLTLLGACAIALAQHDSRNRAPESMRPSKPAPQPATPIQVDGDWSRPLGESADAVVRANNDRLTSYGGSETASANPLRGDSVSVERLPLPDDAPGLAADLASYNATDAPPETALASGQVASEPPGWLSGIRPPSQPARKVPTTDTRPSTTPSPGALPGTSASGSLPATAPSTQGQPARPALPTFPAAPSTNTGVGQAAAMPPTLPSATTPAFNTPTLAAGQANDLSDTQRGAMPPTDLLAPANLVQSPASAATAPTGPGPSPTQPSPGLLPQPNLPPVTSMGPSSAAPAQPYPSPAAASLSDTTPWGTSSQAQGGSPSAAPSMTSLPQRPGAGGNSRSVSSAPSAPGRAPASLAGLVSNQPGNRYLDGSQNPVMQIQKRAPEEIQVGKHATFVIAVRNAGNSTAHEVTVVDSVPRGARFVESVPAVTPDRNGILTWNLGEIAAGEERTISLQIVPEIQGEVGSVATVHFAAQASVRTVATMPKLELAIDAAGEVLIGDSQQMNVTIQNTGTGIARDVRLEADIPEQLRHESGDAQLEAVLGDIRPNETIRISLNAAAVQPGQSMCVVRAVNDDGIQNEKQVGIDVRSPRLVAAIDGPKLRYLERQATYRIVVENVGDALATNLDFVVRLPPGLKFNLANNGGSYDPATHSVSWGLYDLPAGQPAPMELTVLPVEPGQQVLTFSAKGDLGIAAEAKSQVMVDGLAELEFTIGQDNGTIEVGATSTYSVQITNVGNKPDKDVQLAVELPSGSELLAVKAPVQYQTDGRRILFAPIAEMRNKDQLTYRFEIRHNQAGSQKVQAKLTSANWPVAVVKEEGTLVYNDQN